MTLYYNDTLRLQNVAPGFPKKKRKIETVTSRRMKKCSFWEGGLLGYFFHQDKVLQDRKPAVGLTLTVAATIRTK